MFHIYIKDWVIQIYIYIYRKIYMFHIYKTGLCRIIHIYRNIYMFHIYIGLVYGEIYIYIEIYMFRIYIYKTELCRNL